MSGFTFDSNIVIDALAGFEPALTEIRRASNDGGRAWLSRMVWIEVMSKGIGNRLKSAEHFMTGFGIDDIDAEIAARAAALRRERPRLKSPDAVILASAQIHGRVLVTRNIKDFPVNMPGVRVPYLL
ncbi:PIN domain-containing protein [Sphingomonas sp. PAMC 26621]|uniref:PIN domain-containing protein n=1 Tax=Sphingomonas sp. PAMC 26621 TaxID=1112213 RepID=UPI000289F091|nr:PIN domain-containing protein [Sphingomonas sp. PAMC 26621]